MRKADPRCVFALAAYFSAFAVAIREPVGMAALSLAALAANIFLGTDLWGVLKRLRRLLSVIAFVSLAQSVFEPSGVVWLELFGVRLLTQGGVMKGLTVLGRLSVLLMGGAMFTLYRPRELVAGMVQMKLPYEIAYMVLIGIRFMPQMGRQLRDSLIALQLRGVVVEELELKKRLRVYAYILLPAVAECVNNARQLSMSIQMRGFGAYPTRTNYFALTMTRRDKALLLLTLLLAAGTASFILRFPTLLW